jgi:hypothetical protein
MEEIDDSIYRDCKEENSNRRKTLTPAGLWIGGRGFRSKLAEKMSLVDNKKRDGLSVHGNLRAVGVIGVKLCPVSLSLHLRCG